MGNGKRKVGQRRCQGGHKKPVRFFGLTRRPPKRECVSARTECDDTTRARIVAMIAVESGA